MISKYTRCLIYLRDLLKIYYPPSKLSLTWMSWPRWWVGGGGWWVFSFLFCFFTHYGWRPLGGLIHAKEKPCETTGMLA